MPMVKSLGSKLSNLSANTTSKHPTATDSVKIETNLFDDEKEDSSTSPKVARTERSLVTDVFVKHSSAFNSERDSGMSKLQQIQFVEALKKMIISEAALTYPASKDLVVSISRFNKVSHVFCSTTVHTATLLACHVGNQTWIVLGRSDECEYLADAVESLWEKILEVSGKVVGGLNIGDRVGREESIGGVGSVETVVASGR